MKLRAVVMEILPRVLLGRFLPRLGPGFCWGLFFVDGSGFPPESCNAGKPDKSQIAYGSIMSKSAAQRTFVIDGSPTQINFTLAGDGVVLFASMLMELNAGKTPADPDWWTPSELAASLIGHVLDDDAAAHVGPVLAN